MTSRRIIFMGTPDYAVPTLEKLLKSDLDIVAVYSQPPRPAGRGKKDMKSAVQKAAESHGLIVRVPVSLSNKQEQDAYQNLSADVCVVIAYGLILPETFITGTRLGCINAHASLLPRWRGAAPIQRAIMAGDQETGVSIIRMHPTLDTGPIICQEKLKVTEGLHCGDLHEVLAQISAKLIIETVEKLFEGHLLPGIPQTGCATYAKKIKKIEHQIDWRQNANDLGNLIRALAPSPGAWFLHNNQRIKVAKAKVVEFDEKNSPGTILNKKTLTIVCGQNTALQPLVMQREGRSALQITEFLQGYEILPGDILPCPAIN